MIRGDSARLAARIRERKIFSGEGKQFMGSFDFTASYPSTRLPVFVRNVVSTSHPLAA
jgi:hypothetical protein